MIKMSFILGKCQCGCGTDIPILSKHRDILLAFARGHNSRTDRSYALRHVGRKREKHHFWGGGKIIDEEGYVLLRAEGHPRANPHGFYVPEHILVMERTLGRLIPVNEIVHHKNGNKQDNRPENLEVMTRTEHMKLHWKTDRRHDMEVI